MSRPASRKFEREVSEASNYQRPQVEHRSVRKQRRQQLIDWMRAGPGVANYEAATTSVAGVAVGAKTSRRRLAQTTSPM